MRLLLDQNPDATGDDIAQKNDACVQGPAYTYALCRSKSMCLETVHVKFVWIDLYSK